MMVSALKDYPVVVYQDITTDGTPCIVASHPDLPGCEVHVLRAQGEVEARRLLALARASYLTALANSGRPAPEAGQGGVGRVAWITTFGNNAAGQDGLVGNFKPCPV